MIKNKKLVKLLSVIGISSVLLMGCGKSKDVEPLRLPTAEEAVEQFNLYNKENNVNEMARLYADCYVDSTGYDLGTIQKILKNSRKEAEIITSELVSMEDFDANIKKATIKITSKVNNEETTENYDYAVIKEEDGWAVSPDGIIKCEDFNIPMSNKGELNLNLAKNVTLYEGGMIRVNVFNDSKNKFMFGSNDNKCDIIVETSTGKYVTTMDEPTKLEKNVNSYFLARMKELNGEITKVTVTNIYELDKDENIVEDSKKDIIVYEK